MPIQGLNFTILASHEAHQSYQSTGSFIVYNPNDGVAFVATDRTATGLSWDYKVPSQSGGKFPGPINSYLSIYYLDQSGGGAPGQIVVYASPETVNIPYFWSIGRATQIQSSSLDIVGGPQPGNPGAGIGRLWIDGGGHLNVLQPSGANYLELDSANYNSVIVLGGDLYGSINAAHVGLQNTSYVGVIDTGGTIHRGFGMMSDNNNYVFSGSGGYIYFYNDGVVGPSSPMGSWNGQNGVLSVSNPGLGASYVFVQTAIAAPTLYLHPNNSGPYIQDAGSGIIRYDVGAGGIHSFETQSGGYGPVQMGSLTVNGAANITGGLTVSGGISSSNGLNVTGGFVGFPAGSLARSYLATAAGARFIGAYQAGVSFSTSTLNTWIATPLTFNFTIGANESGIIIVAATISLTGTIVGTTLYAAIALNGGIGLYKMVHTPQANYATSIDITEYFSGLASGSYTAQVYVQGNAGTISFNAACHHFLVGFETVF